MKKFRSLPLYPMVTEVAEISKHGQLKLKLSASQDTTAGGHLSLPKHADKYVLNHHLKTTRGLGFPIDSISLLLQITRGAWTPLHLLESLVFCNKDEPTS